MFDINTKQFHVTIDANILNVKKKKKKKKKKKDSFYQIPVNIMIIVPLNDCKPGIAKVSFKKLEELAIQPGTWVNIFDKHSKVRLKITFNLLP